MSRDIAPFGVRMPTELKVLVEEAAAASGRSMNAEVVTRLQESCAAPVLASAPWMNLHSLADAIAAGVAHKLKKIADWCQPATRRIQRDIYAKNGRAHFMRDRGRRGNSH